ncbi:hypothetical protein [Calothrix sp. UHCC 0171]|uniref:hypothetical protein n=1 Tax=Calothrix sp. UHCC 0171 TaxID=3110245 RepID=UPI002B206202|nr:hypothetical protein [Calothrix sp. UHCC 0171]MEA5573000.1 hypothetical protein [Calothrix sp. UHCC 0171]
MPHFERQQQLNRGLILDGYYPSMNTGLSIFRPRIRIYNLYPHLQSEYRQWMEILFLANTNKSP